MKANFLIKNFMNKFSVHQKRISYLVGQSSVQKNSEDVELRGLHLHGKNKDLPSLIFFPDLFDQVESWLNFFTNADILEQRNVFILYPRNMGSSDWNNEKFHPVEHLDQLGKDVERFMYTHQISTATLGGHGFGAKYALMASCYKSQNVTGYFGINYSPLNYKYHSFAQELKEALNFLVQLDCNKLGRKNLISLIEQTIENKKLALLFINSLKHSKERGIHFNFNLEFIQKNLDQIFSWETQYGLFPGRSFFMLPEHSNRVHLGTNTLPMYNVCPKLHGLNQDIQILQTEEENEEKNHWIYEDKNLQDQAVKKLGYFLNFYDGINVQYKNKLDMLNKVELRKQSGEKDGSNENVKVPEHYHHNWKYQE